MNQTEKIESLQEALRIVFLERARSLESGQSDLEMGRVLQSAGLVMESGAYQQMIDRLAASAFQQSLGELLDQAIIAGQVSKEELAARLRIPVPVMNGLLEDHVYTNNVPVVLFKNLLLALNISFESAQASIRKTFSILQNQLGGAHGFISVSPAFRRRSQTERGSALRGHGDGRELFENAEALDKYLTRLGEIMK